MNPQMLKIHLAVEWNGEPTAPWADWDRDLLREVRDDINRELGESPAKLSTHERVKMVNGLLVELHGHFDLLHADREALSTTRAAEVIWSALSRYQSSARWVEYQRTNTMPVVQPAKATHQLVEIYLLRRKGDGRDPHIPSARSIRRSLDGLRQSGQIRG